MKALGALSEVLFALVRRVVAWRERCRNLWRFRVFPCILKYWVRNWGEGSAFSVSLSEIKSLLLSDGTSWSAELKLSGFGCKGSDFFWISEEKGYSVLKVRNYSEFEQKRVLLWKRSSDDACLAEFWEEESFLVNKPRKVLSLLWILCKWSWNLTVAD